MTRKRPLYPSMSEERRETIRRMAAMPGSGIDPSEVEAIIGAYNDIIGF